MPASRQHWIVKQEPSSYSWDQFVSEGQTAWTGVRNFQARNHLRSMRVGDLAFFYHSVIGKQIVGIAVVSREAYPDPTATEGDWVCVDLQPQKTLPHPVSLESLKAHPTLCTIGLIRQSRLSVIPISPREFTEIVTLATQGS